jgi:hypothetical protein
MSVPRVSDLVALRRLAQYLVGTPRAVQRMPWQRATGLKLFSDTDFAGCPRTRRSTSAGVAMRGLHLIRHYSRTQKVVTLSSAEAELGGAVQGASEGLGSQAIALDLGIKADLTLLVDSSAAIGICRRSGIGRVRHLAVGQLWVQERVRDKTLRLEKVAGEANPADIGTKHLGAEVMRRCMGLAGLVPRAGRSSAAPALTATVRPFLDERPARGPPQPPRPAVRALRCVQGPRPQQAATPQAADARWCACGPCPDPATDASSSELRARWCACGHGPDPTTGLPAQTLLQHPESPRPPGTWREIWRYSKKPHSAHLAHPESPRLPGTWREIWRYSNKPHSAHPSSQNQSRREPEFRDNFVSSQSRSRSWSVSHRSHQARCVAPGVLAEAVVVTTDASAKDTPRQTQNQREEQEGRRQQLGAQRPPQEDQGRRPATPSGGPSGATRCSATSSRRPGTASRDTVSPKAVGSNSVLSDSFKKTRDDGGVSRAVFRQAAL